MAQTISISTQGVKITNDHDYHGFLKVTNDTGAPIYSLQVTPKNDDEGSSFGFAYAVSNLEVYTGQLLPGSNIPAGTLFVPVDSSYPDLHIDYTQTDGGTTVSSTQSIKAFAGAPKIKSTSPSIETWQYARCSGTLTVRNNALVNREVWAKLGTRTPVSVPAGGSTDLDDVTIHEDSLQVSLSKDMSNSESLTVIHQDGVIVNVSDPQQAGEDFCVDTQVLSADTNGQQPSLTVNYTGAQTIQVDTVSFDRTETVIGTIDSATASLTVPVDDTIAYLRIGSPTGGGDGDTPAAAPSEFDDDGLPQFIPLGGDPVILVKHTGYTTGGKSR